MQRASTGVSVFLFAALLACGGPPLDESAPVGDGAIDTLTLAVIDSIGVELGDSNYVFGAIEGIAWGPDGNIAVQDMAMGCIRIYSPRGEFMRQISRRGNGPGELQNAAFLAVSEDGHIYLGGEGSEILGLHVFDYSTGEWLGSQASTDQPPTNLEGSSGDSYIYKQLKLEVRDDSPLGVVEFGRKGFEDDEPLTVYFEDYFEIDYSDLTEAISKTWYGYDIASDFDGRVFIAPRSSTDYVVYGWDSVGTELFTLRMDLERVEKTGEELEIEEILLRAKAGAMGIEEAISLDPEPYRPMIRGLEVDGYGNLWVLRGGSPDPFFDIYDTGGRLTAHARIEPAPPDGDTWRFHIGRPGMLAYAEDPADGYQKVYVLEMPEGLGTATGNR